MRTLVLASLALAAAPLLADEPEPTPAAGAMPAVITASAGERPVWVSAAAAEGADGRLDWERLGSNARRWFERAVETQRNLAARPVGAPVTLDCVNYALLTAGLARDTTVLSVAALVKTVFAAYLGEVTDEAPGFFLGRPATLLQVKVDRRVLVDELPHGDWNPDPYLYAVYPPARFSSGGVRFCNDDPRFVFRPVPGDRILLLPAFFPAPDADKKVAYGVRSFFATRRGRVVPPPAARHVPELRAAGDLQDVIEVLRAAAVPDR